MKHLLFLHHADTFEQTLTYFYICSVKFILCPISFAVFFFISVWHHLFSILQIPAIKQERNEYLGFMMTYFRFFDVFHFKMIDVLSVKNYVRPDNHDTAWQVSYRPMNTTRPAAMTVMDPPCSLRSGPTGLWTMESTWSCTSSSSVYTRTESSDEDRMSLHSDRKQHCWQPGQLHSADLPLDTSTTESQLWINLGFLATPSPRI